MIKGYEYSKNQYVLFTEEELKALIPEPTNAVEITEFVPLERVDPVYYEKSYYLGPDKGGDRPYRLLAEAMKRTGPRGPGALLGPRQGPVRAAAALENRSRHAAAPVRDELRSFGEVPVGPAEVKGAGDQARIQLIEQIATDTFNPEEYEDKQRLQVRALIERKVQGEELVAPPVEGAQSAGDRPDGGASRRASPPPARLRPRLRSRSPTANRPAGLHAPRPAPAPVAEVAREKAQRSKAFAVTLRAMNRNFALRAPGAVDSPAPPAATRPGTSRHCSAFLPARSAPTSAPVSWRRAGAARRVLFFLPGFSFYCARPRAFSPPACRSAASISPCRTCVSSFPKAGRLPASRLRRRRQRRRPGVRGRVEARVPARRARSRTALPRLGVPHVRPSRTTTWCPRRRADAGKRPAFGKLSRRFCRARWMRRCGTRAARRPLAVRNRTRSWKENNTRRAAPAAAQETGADVGADLAGRKTEQCRDVPGRVAAGRSRAIHCARRTEGEVPVHRPQCTANALTSLSFFSWPLPRRERSGLRCVETCGPVCGRRARPEPRPEPGRWRRGSP